MRRVSRSSVPLLIGPLVPLVLLALVALLVLCLQLPGCSSESGIVIDKVPNALPETKLTGQSPAPADSGFIIHFYWTGEDTDGRVVGFQWKLSNNGLDGIGVRDTLTVDPSTGDTLNPWHWTAVHDSTYLVTADLPGWPPDHDLPPPDQRSYQTHSFFVRAVDNDGGVDPSPAMVSFTATTITPTIIIDRPASTHDYKTAQYAPPTVTFGWSGTDPDLGTGIPTQVRYLFKRGVLPNGGYVTTKYDFERNLEAVCSFSDSAWSDWMPYRQSAEARTVTLRDLPARDAQGGTIGYLFAVQAMDTAGAVSPDRSYARNVANFIISTLQMPYLKLYERYLGVFGAAGVSGTRVFDIAPGQPLDFQWVATTEHYLSTVVAYRYGWDIADPGDENDPGWALPPGNTRDHQKSPVRSFVSGTHTLTVHAWDEAGGLTRMVVVLNVVPAPATEEYPLLVVDDVVDRNSHAWVGSDGREYDNDAQRDAFWLNALTGPGGVSGFDLGRDVIDLEQVSDFGYRKAVLYSHIVWLENRNPQSYVWSDFDPMFGLKYVWLEFYQKLDGHVFLCGQQPLQAFAGDYGGLDGSEPTPMPFPFIFDAPFGYLPGQYGGVPLWFGEQHLPDGTARPIGPMLYPYAAAGIDALDHAAQTASYDDYGTAVRKANCAGLKGLVLDPTYRTTHAGGAGVPDTILTSTVIDFRDNPSQYPAKPRLEDTFLWGLDEFYDTNVTARPTPINPQILPGGQPAIEPMWRFESRFDWIDQVHARHGDPDWPGNAYTADQLRNICGSRALGTDGRAIVADAPVGFISHKTELTKPTPGGDVYWGFDPSRFDPQPMQRAIRWVLRDVFGLRMTSP